MEFRFCFYIFLSPKNWVLFCSVFHSDDCLIISILVYFPGEKWKLAFYIMWFYYCFVYRVDLFSEQIQPKAGEVADPRNNFGRDTPWKTQVIVGMKIQREAI